MTRSELHSDLDHIKAIKSEKTEKNDSVATCQESITEQGMSEKSMTYQRLKVKEIK